MAKPAIVIIDDSPAVLSKLKNDLDKRYSERFHIVGVAMGQQALTLLKKMSLHNEPLALLLVDEKLDEMSGSELLKDGWDLYPKARRVLLITSADTHAAIQAINNGRIDYYLIKPWDPPEEHLYPAMDDLLIDWQISYEPSLDALRVIDHRWSPKLYEIGRFLARNQVPYHWLDVETSKEAHQMLELLEMDYTKLPIVIFPNGSYLVQPDVRQIAEKINLKTHAEKPFYDLIIVGSGPAGLAAAVYGASEGLSTLVLEREASGGQAGMSTCIENYLGFPAGLSGGELALRAVTQAKRFGAEIVISQSAKSVTVNGQYRSVLLEDGSEVRCHALLLACGVSYRKLDVPGMDALIGAGVYYGGSMAEARFCKNGDVFVVGGGNSAGQAALYFAKYARQVTMLVLEDSLSRNMSKYLVDRIENVDNIDVKTSVRVAAVHGNSHLQSITIVNEQSHEEQTLPAISLFIFIGTQPHTNWLQNVVKMDEKDFILTGRDLLDDGLFPKQWLLDREPFFLETNVPGIFAAGDVRHGSIKRVASSVGEGAMAVQLIYQYLAQYPESGP